MIVVFFLRIFAFAPDEREGPADIARTIIKPIHAADGDFFAGAGIDLRNTGVEHVLGDELPCLAVVSVSDFKEEVFLAVENLAGERIAAAVHAIDGGGDKRVAASANTGEASFDERFLVIGAAVFGIGAIAMAHDAHIVAHLFPDLFFNC